MYTMYTIHTDDHAAYTIQSCTLPQDCHGDNSLHIAARGGWGSLLTRIIGSSEKMRPGCSVGALEQLNYAKKTPQQVGRNETVRAIMGREVAKSKESKESRKQTKDKLKR